MVARRTHPVLRSIAVLAIVVAAVVATGRPAAACSCAAVDLGRLLPEADGAFVGTSVDRTAISDQEVAITFEVERVVKGDFGPTALVRTNAYGASCGLEFLDGPRTGLLLDRGADGVWESSLCQQVPADDLLAFSPHAAPPDPGVAAVDPRPAFPWWGLALVGLVAVGAAVAFAVRGRRGPA